MTDTTPALPAAALAPRRRRPWLAIAAKLLAVPQAVFGVVVITIIVLSALLAPLITPYDPQAMDFKQMMSGMTA